MKTTCDLTNQNCIPCEGGVDALDDQQAQALLVLLHHSWEITDNNKKIERRFTFKNFSKTVLFVNTLSWLAEKQQHHPDICFGYGYCNVVFSTHAIDGLSENDFICAAKLDELIK